MTFANFRKLLLSKTSLILLGTLLIVLAGFQYRQSRERNGINQEIDGMKRQQAELEQKNQEINDSLQYFGSPDYKDRLARQQLGLEKQGEIMYNFPDAPAAQQNPSAPQGGKAQLLGEGNMHKWWEFLFGNH